MPRIVQSNAAALNRKSLSMPVTEQKSGIVSKRQAKRADDDLRVVRSRQAINTAFVELIQRRAYGNIRVSDIAKKAKVGRATFYAHYSSKEDLLRSQFNRNVAPMLRATEGSDCTIDATPLLRHIQSAPSIYRSLMTAPDAGQGPRVLRQCFEQRLSELLHSTVPRDSEDLRTAVLIRHVASSLLAVIECWLERAAAEDPANVQRLFADLVKESLREFGRIST